VPLQFVETPDHLAIPKRLSIRAFGDTFNVLVGTTSLAAGTNILLSAAVAADKLHVLQNICYNYTGTVAGVYINVFILHAAVYYYLFGQPPLLTGQMYDRQGTWLMKAGDQLGMVIYGATLNDDAALWTNGYTVDLK